MKYVRFSENIMADMAKSGLWDFLEAEFLATNIAIPDSVALPKSLGEWSLKRDECGFVVTASVQAWRPLKDLFDTVFSPPVFESNGRLIYRNDERQLTVMLASGTTATSLIVLRWGSPGVRARVAEAQNAALAEIVDGAFAEVHGLLEQACAEDDACKSASLFDSATRWTEEMAAAFGQCGARLCEASGKSAQAATDRRETR